jgi:hypothetical protein
MSKIDNKTRNKNTTYKLPTTITKQSQLNHK